MMKFIPALKSFKVEVEFFLLFTVLERNFFHKFCLHMAEELLIECSAFLDIAIDDEVYSCTGKLELEVEFSYFSLC